MPDPAALFPLAALGVSLLSIILCLYVFAQHMFEARNIHELTVEAHQLRIDYARRAGRLVEGVDILDDEGEPIDAAAPVAGEAIETVVLEEPDPVPAAQAA